MHNVSRKETAAVVLSMNKSQYDANKADFDILSEGNNRFDVREGDSVSINWGFDLDYVEGIDIRMSALLRIADNATISGASIKELNYGKFLLEELLTKFRKLEERLNHAN